MEYSRVLNNKAAFYVDLKRYREAIPLLEESINMNITSGRKINLTWNYINLAQAYYGIGNFKKAYDYQNIRIQYADSIVNKENLEKINELETKYQTEKKEAEIALQKEEIKTLNEKAKVDKLTKGLYAGGMASALALFGLSVFGYRQRIKKNRIAREKQEEIYRQEIAHKKKELASQTLHLVQKNTFLEELKENLENLKNSPDKFKMEFRRIVMLLKKEKASDKDWETFKTYFSEVHNDFDQKLKTLYTDISEKEIRLAAFLRMNLTTKEIAATLNVLPDSILKSKYRLKKKLGLDKETDLTSFLNTL
jgi:tetratricopeptide (TPR) repeat protein